MAHLTDEQIKHLRDRAKNGNRHARRAAIKILRLHRVAVS